MGVVRHFVSVAEFNQRFFDIHQQFFAKVVLYFLFALGILKSFLIIQNLFIQCVSHTTWTKMKYL